MIKLNDFEYDSGVVEIIFPVSHNVSSIILILLESNLFQLDLSIYHLNKDYLSLIRQH